MVVDHASMVEKVDHLPPMPEHLGANGLCVMCFPTASSTLVFVDKTNTSELLPFVGGGRGKGGQPPQDSSDVVDPEEARRIEDGIANSECEPAVREALGLVWKNTYGNHEEIVSHPIPAGEAPDGNRTKGVTNSAKVEEEAEEDLLLLRLDSSAMAAQNDRHGETKKRKRTDSEDDAPPKHRSKHSRAERKEKEKKMKREAKRQHKTKRERESKEEKLKRKDPKKEEEEFMDSEDEEESDAFSDSSENDSISDSMNAAGSSSHRARKVGLSAPSSSSSSAVPAAVSPSFVPSARHVASDAELLKYSQGIRSSILFFTQVHPQMQRPNVSVHSPTGISSTSLLSPLDAKTPSQSSTRASAPPSPALFFPSPPENGPIEKMENIEEEEKEEDNLLYHLRALAQCNVTMEQLQQLGIGRVVGFLLQPLFPARVQVLAKAILDYWFSSLETATKEVLLDTTDVRNCSVESIIGDDEEEEDRGLGDALFREMSAFQATIYSILVMGFEEEVERFTNAEPTRAVSPSIRSAFPLSFSDATTDLGCAAASGEEGEAKERLHADEKGESAEAREKLSSQEKDRRIPTEESVIPFVEESRLRAICEAMETSLLRCQDVDIRVAVLHRLTEEKNVRNALLEGIITAEEVVEKEEQIALGVGSPLYSSSLITSPLFSPSSEAGSPTSAGATTLYQCPSCGERNAFRTMYTVSAHDNFPTLLHCRNCDQTWSS